MNARSERVQSTANDRAERKVLQDMKKNYGINGKKAVLKNLKNVMEAVGQKYSIRIGIIGEKAYEKHPDTDLTNAQLGAVHEFGADININHPGGQPYTFLENGQARFVSKSSKAGQEAIKEGRVTKPHQIHIKVPERSFLRKVLFDKDIQNYIYDKAGTTSESSEAGTTSESSEAAKLELLKHGNADFMKDVAETIGAAALEQVQIAFKVGGQPEPWQSITQFTKEHRKNDPESKPLQDGGELLDSISFDVKRVK